MSVFVNPNGADSNHTITIPSQTCTSSEYCIKKSTIAKICKDLNTTKSREPDNVFLKRQRNQYFLPYTISSKYQAPSQVPDDMKKWDCHSHIQKGSKSNVGNNRPVTSLDIVGKIHERCIYILLYILFIMFVSSQQVGFQSRKSTIFQLLTSLHHIHFDNDNSKNGLLSFDFAKAFDKVNQKNVVAKLSSLGEQRYMLAVITDYLQNRRQAVRINTKSPPLSGVP